MDVRTENKLLTCVVVVVLLAILAFCSGFIHMGLRKHSEPEPEIHITTIVGIVEDIQVEYISTEMNSGLKKYRLIMSFEDGRVEEFIWKCEKFEFKKDVYVEIDVEEEYIHIHDIRYPKGIEQ